LMHRPQSRVDPSGISYAGVGSAAAHADVH
jgi:hypothetical protein